jgi:xanthine dehydrogenase YagT iron-sulfur-binding subunit
MKDPSEQNRNGPGLSRRQFLKGTGAAAATTALATVPIKALASAEADEAKQVAGMGPAPVTIQLTVNGKQITQAVEPRVTLLDALRNYMDVTGCKRVCDRGTCGACTVMLDGKPIYACTMLAVEAQGHEIKTAEALFTPGFVVAMRAAFDKNPDAKPPEIEEALAGNICRCGTYQQMRDAIAALCKTQGKGA